MFVAFVGAPSPLAGGAGDANESGSRGHKRGHSPFPGRSRLGLRRGLGDEPPARLELTHEPARLQRLEHLYRNLSPGARRELAEADPTASDLDVHSALAATDPRTLVGEAPAHI